MTIIQQAIHQGREILQSHVDSPHQEALTLLSFSSGKSKEFLFAHSDESIDDETFELFQHYLFRRINGEPMAYIQQRKEFWSLPLTVSPDVLIPRPETELIVETTLANLPNTNKPKILDLGTGSGCIAIALAKELPGAEIIACDISPVCIELAKQNASQLEINNITFIVSDWFNSITECHFNFIVSNPPYIAQDDSEIEFEVSRYEPEVALFSEHNGLKDLLHIIEHAVNYLSPKGTLILEHGYQQGPEVRAHLSQKGYNKIKTLKDIQQLERVTLANRCS